MSKEKIKDKGEKLKGKTQSSNFIFLSGPRSSVTKRNRKDDFSTFLFVIIFQYYSYTSKSQLPMSHTFCCAKRVPATNFNLKRFLNSAFRNLVSSLQCSRRHRQFLLCKSAINTLSNSVNRTSINTHHCSRATQAEAEHEAEVHSVPDHAAQIQTLRGHV